MTETMDKISLAPKKWRKQNKKNSGAIQTRPGNVDPSALSRTQSIIISSEHKDVFRLEFSTFSRLPSTRLSYIMKL